MIRIGDTLRFAPTAFVTASEMTQAHTRYRPKYPVKVTGTVCGIHRGHRWYRVRFAVNGCTMYECFKF